MSLPAGWPEGKPLALSVNVMLEGWTDDSAPGIGPMGNPLKAGVLDLQARSWADYGPKVGAWRLLDILQRLQVRSVFYVSGILAEVAPQAKCAALSGPTFAIEVARGIPSAIVAASRDLTTASMVQQLFNGPTFRVYASTDLAGVELGGALKNVIAIAAGIGDGLGFGDNSKAALVTRAMAEIRRLSRE